MAKKSRETDQMTIEGTEETEMLARLSERVDRAVTLIQQLRKENEEMRLRADEQKAEIASLTSARDSAKSAAEEAAKRLDSMENEGSSRLDDLEAELDKLRGERGAVRSKVEGILEKLGSLEA